ncbi:site-specific integrase [Spirosoma pomorum]
MNIGTGYKVMVSQWSLSKQRVKNVVNAVNGDSINYFLDKLESTIKEYIDEARANRVQLTKEALKKQIDGYLHPVVQNEKPKTLIDFVNWYIETCPNRLVRGSKARTGRFISTDTVRRYKTTLNGLIAFSTTYKYPLSFENIDINFYNSFTAWLIEKNYATNNVSKYIENVKGFMSAAVDEGLTTNLAYRKFSNLREDVENIYLTEAELQRIYELDLSKNVRLDKVRDSFLFASWTGLRFSDFSNLQKEHIKIDENGNKHLDLKQHKTGIKIYIPIVNEIIIEILDKYNNCLPESISNQKTNDYLKEICAMASINERILKHTTKGGKSVIKTVDGWDTKSDGVEKWMLVTTHTARRSFATNMFKRGMKTILIMKLTGHKKESEFLKYIKIDTQETLSLISQYLTKNAPVQ